MKVSVVIPAYNAEQFLGEAIESALGQTSPPAEVIVVDDGSTDCTAEVSGRFAQVRILSGPHAGVSVARNRGVAAAEGEAIAFLDADDTWDPRKLEMQVSALEGNPGAGIAWCQHRCVFEGAVPAWFRGPRDGSPAQGHLLIPSLIRRSTWLLVGEFDPTLTHGEDGDWLARAVHLGVPTVAVDQTLMNYRIHDRNASGDAEAVQQGILQTLRASIRRKHENEE